MAASEGQLAIEFVQALTAEARAHREYLQLLYTLTLGVVGGGILLLAAAFFWLGQRSIRRVEASVRTTFERKAESLLGGYTEETSKKINKVKEEISEIEKIIGESRGQLDAIASLASEARAASRDTYTAVLGAKNNSAVIFNRSDRTWIRVMVLGAVEHLLELDNANFLDLQHPYDKPSVIIMDIESVTPNEITKIASIFANNSITQFVLISETLNHTSIRHALNFLPPPPLTSVASNPAQLATLLRSLPSV